MAAPSPQKSPDNAGITRRRFLKISTRAGLFGAAVLAGCGRNADFDILIRNGLVCDGSGKEPFPADVGIRGDTIAAVGDLGTKTGRREISASGYIVAPGFIDIHSHSDEDLLVDGRAHSKIRQGVTTEIVGQDGDSFAPLNEEMRTRLQESLQKAYGLKVDWHDFTGYFRRLRREGISVNLGSMVGAGTLRAFVVGYEARTATAEEVARMQELLRRSLQQGARHLSSGLEYTPGSFASAEELAALCRILGPSGVYATHMRNEDDRVLEAVEEAIHIATAGGCRLHISHLKASGRRNWPKLDAILQRMQQARQRGLSVTCDRYPYIAYSTGLTSLFPLWSREGRREDFVARLQNPDLLPRIRRAVLAKIDMLGDWNAVLISSVREPEDKAFEGKRLGDLAQEMGRDPFDLLRELLLRENGRGGMVGFAMSVDNTARILADPHCAVASDGSARSTEGPLAEGNPHPRNFGTFPRVLRYYVREQKLLSLQEAVRKMTSLPAAIIGLRNRGLLRTGYFADIVIFDPQRVADRATFTNPKRYPEGIDYVLVNGKAVIFAGEHTQARPGRILAAKT